MIFRQEVRLAIAIVFIVAGSGRRSKAEPASQGLCFDHRTPVSTSEIPVSVEPPSKLNGLTKLQIYDLRRSLVSKYPGLATKGYEPDDYVFGQIFDGRPWWGLEGIYFYGSGNKSIEGPAEESRFLTNPFLLVGLREPIDVLGKKPDGASEYYPKAHDLVYRCQESQAGVLYDVSRYFDFYASHDWPEEYARTFQLVSYNARDFGYKFLYVDPDSSLNVETSGDMYQPLPILQYIHNGGSCGYPGGCNNMSHFDASMMVYIKDQPARIAIKLWRQRPASGPSRPDATFIIDLSSTPR